MKILFVLEHYYPNIGGVEKLFKLLAEQLAANGHQVTVVTTKFKKQLSSKEAINGVNVVRLPLFNRYFFTFFSWIFTLKYAKQAQIIHTTSYNAALPAYILSKIYSKPCIITFHEVWGKLWFKLPFLTSIERRLFYQFEQFILRLNFTKIVAVSDFTHRQLATYQRLKNKLVTIHNGVSKSNSELIKVNKSATFSFTFFGRLGVSKGLDLVIPAAIKFIKKYPESIFNLVIPRHPKALFKSVKKLAFKSNLSQIRFYHELHDEKLEDLLLSSHCVVIPSYSEGFGFAALETSMLEVPIISSGLGALPEVVSGKVILAKNQSVEAYVEALEAAKNNQFQEVVAKHWDVKNTIKKYEDLYFSVLNGQ